MISPRLTRLLRRVALAPCALLIGQGSAEAHVKWFCAYDIAGQPEGLGNVLCQDFEILSLTAIAVLLVGCLVEKTSVGAAMIRSFDRLFGSLEANTELWVRATLGFFLVCLWTLGGIILTPELKTASPLVPLAQLGMAACLLSRKTMPVAALGIVVLFGTGIVQYGLFHMMDYPIFLGVAAYIAAVGLQRDIFGHRPIDVLRWAAAITLMWASVEKWAYPEWSYPLFISHPNLSMGYDPAFFMRAAGVVEFTLSFALLLTPLVRRAAAVMLTATFVSAIGEFGKVDAIGHAPIIVVMLAIAADSAKREKRAPAVYRLPLQYGGALAAVIALYYASHALSYQSIAS